MRRTTVTLDADVDRLLHDAMQRRRISFKEALNESLRLGLAELAGEPEADRFVVHARPMGLRPGVDPARLNQLADDLEAEAFQAVAESQRSAERG
jgi:hypothetical protein